MNDTERLDWLTRQHATVYRGLSGTHWVFVNESVSSHLRHGVIGDTLREAIDKAMLLAAPEAPK